MSISKNISKLSGVFVIAAHMVGVDDAQAKSRHGAEANQNLKCDQHLRNGTASWYKSGKLNANGTRFYAQQVSVAHPSLPFGTIIKIVSRDPDVQGSVIAEVKDRGPFTGGRIVDLSSGAANLMPGFKDEGTPQVSIYKCQPR